MIKINLLLVNIKKINHIWFKIEWFNSLDTQTLLFNLMKVKLKQLLIHNLVKNIIRIKKLYLTLILSINLLFLTLMINFLK